MLWNKNEWFFFSDKEIQSTGANPKDLDPVFMTRLSHVRREFNKFFILLPNGLTTGNHSSKLHPKGRACDFTIPNLSGEGDILRLYHLCRRHGLNGFGYYKNHIGVYSFHVDDRETPTIWYGTKEKKEDKWTMQTL